MSALLTLYVRRVKFRSGSREKGLVDAFDLERMIRLLKGKVQ